MSPSEVAAQVEESVVKWSKQLIEGHATPFLMIGFGVDHMQGRSVVCLREGVSPKEAVAWLEKVVGLLKEAK